MITVKIDGEDKKYQEGILLETIADEYQEKYNHLIALAIVNGKMKELSKKLTEDSELTFITLKDTIGHMTYVRTALMILSKAVEDVVGKENLTKLKVDYSIGHGYYCSTEGNFKVDGALAADVNKRMREIVDDRIEIIKRPYHIDEAMELFRTQGMTDKEKLFKYRRSSYVNVYCMDGYYDYYYGYMFPNTSYVKYFDVIAYEGGLMLLIPEKKNPDRIVPFEPREKLFKTLRESDEWGKKLGIDTVGDLNNEICKGNISELILVQEALQERKIGEIAKEIAERKGVKFVMIAGPSSSGKTTFSHRLSVQLKTYGLTPHPIGLDDYFVNREYTPRDENGDYNFECLEAIDVEKFNQDMCALLEGKTVELPSFNFKTGTREYKGNYKTLGPDDILVIEGIHGLNDKMSYALPNESKYKIYISALTSLNVDEHNRISTTDGRLLRRMVRDARTRGSSAQRTISMWPSVRRGEEENIFPFQESADAMFNSVLIYELAVLKQFAEPLLFSIGKDEPEYFEAKRLLKFLGYFIGVSSENLPQNSICREFVGGSCFNV